MEKTKVMIVDDHEQMRTLLAEIVEQDDSLTVAATAADGAEAYRLICGMDPDVVRLDLIMPEMDGLTLLERLRADSGDRKCPKVIMISAVSEESMVREAFRLGVSYYMIKPFLPEVLLGRIKALMLPEEEKPGQSRKIFPCEDLRSPERREMETEIAQMLHRIGVPAHIRGYAYLKEAVPMAFRDAFLYDIAPQLGTRCSRRLKGEYVMTANDFAFATKHDDVIAWHSTICQINDCGPVEIPYRCILPQKVEGLLCPGRHLSADDVAIDWLNLIPQCVGTGQAAGVAAAVAVADGTTVREVDIRKVQDILCGQDVPLPRNAKTDPSYTACCEAHEYGLYTDLAKQARAAAEGKGEDLNQYRQW